jgi:hypothetical protein
MKEYKVIIFKESTLGSILLGQSKVDPIKFTNFLNLQAEEGWRVITMEREIRRTLLFFGVESFLVILEREKA